ncbi:MAG: Na/Pi cotransporter family protein [Bacteroidota bacterium]
MEIHLLDILKILGSLAFFIYGMKVMSEGMQRAAGSQMRRILRRMTRNPWIGLFSGLLVTTLVQSSSATTVMTVSFVNAGLISLAESAGIIMGTNIGTTITGWLVALGIGNFSLSNYSLPIIALGLPLLFLRQRKLRYWGEVLVGFALLFLGLSFLSENVPDFRDHPEALEFLSSYSQLGYGSIFIFMIFGMVITAVIQSSSAAMALTLVMLSKGWVPVEIAAAMILGENLGTTITAEIASWVGNVYAKRTARIHVLFNFIGVLWMSLALPWFLKMIHNYMVPSLQSVFPFTSADIMALAIFHTLFNLANALLLIGFIPLLIRLASQTVSSKGGVDENFRLAYINSLLKTPELSIIEVQKELAKYGEVTSRMNGFTKRLLLSTNKKEQRDLIRQIAKYEDITDRVELELVNYLDKISSDEVSTRISIRIRSILNICSDLERIGDIFYQMSRSIERKIDEKIWFNQEQRDRLSEMFDLVEEAFGVMVGNLSNPEYGKVSLFSALEIEKKTNHLLDGLNQTLPSTKKGEEVHSNSTYIFNSLFSSLEKVGDHIYNISEAIVADHQ